MASNAYRGVMFLNCLFKMLVLLILITNTVDFCQGKALLEETESNRGKRSYELPNSGLHQTYDPQSNAEHWMKGEFYEPQVDGQAIYVPAVDQPKSYQEFLDTYYKAYAPAWNLVTPAPYYDVKAAKTTTTKSTSDIKYSSNYKLSVSKESEVSNDMRKLDSDLQETEDYDGSESVVKRTKLSKENSKTLDELEEVSTESLNPKLPKTKPDYNKHSQPAEFSVKMSTSGESSSESRDYDDPNVVDKTVVSEFGNEKLEMSVFEDKEIFEEPVVLESFKKSELTETKPKDYNRFDIPVVKTKQASKINNAKDVHKNTNEPVTIRASDKHSVKYELPISKENEFSVKMSTSGNASSESRDYDDPNVIERTVVTEFDNEKLDISVFEDKEIFEEPVVRESFKKSELTETKPKDHNRFDMPVVKTVKQKPKSTNARKKPSTFKNISQPKTLKLKGVAKTKPKIDTNLNLENSNGDVFIKPEAIIPNTNDFRGLSSMNSNIWSMLFNPNAEQNKLKLKRCITRSNETGFCTYIQNCEVPHIATSLEQLLNNACVIDDIFIGVCCPEFPVQTVKVQWDQTPSDLHNPIEDEFGHIAEDCGIRSNEASKLQSWPWKAPLVSMSNGKIFCGGVVISEDHVLTAAHCTTKIPKNQILVRLGQYDDESGDDYAVVEIKRHAQYNSRTLQNDIALLKLGRRIMNDVHIGIVCLPDEEHQNNHDGTIATLLGWRGMLGSKSRNPEFLKVISNKECESGLGMKVASTSLCTETRKESERTCNADSGAPLVIEDNGAYEVIGILSWNRNDCDQRFPSTFSRVSSYAGWIKNHIG